MKNTEMIQQIISKEIYERYVKSLLQGNKLTCSKIVQDLKSDMIIKHIYEYLFKLSLYHIGELWEYNKISVAVEHMSTSITESIMNSLYEDISSEKFIDKKVIISSAEDEYHQIGGKMAADIFEQKGWDSYYLGANTPTLELIRFASDIKPDIIGISLTVYFHLSTLQKMIHAIQKELKNIPIIIGGQAFRHGSGTNLVNKFENVYFIESLDYLEKFIESQNI